MRKNVLPLQFIVFLGLMILLLPGARAQQNPTAPGAWSIVASYTIPGKASGLAYDGTYIYFGIYGANGSNIHKFDPATGSNSLQCVGPFDDAFGLTWKGPNLVTISQPSSAAQPASALEFTLSGTQVSAITLPNHYMSGIAYDNGSYWVCTYYPDPGTVYHINSSGTVLSQFTPPNTQPWDICMQGSDLWIADYYGNMLYKVSSTGTLIESHASQIGKPSGVVYDGTYLWYCAGELSSNSTLYKVDLNGSGTPVITVPVTSHNYGTVTIGQSPTWNCQVQNTGTSNLVLSSLGIPPGQPISTTFSFPHTLAAGGSVNIPLTYTPVTAGPLFTDVYINSNDPIHPTVTVNLTGDAVIGGAHINITDTLHDWGERRAGAYSRWYLQVNNNGSQNLSISALAMSDPHFLVDGDVQLPLTVTPLQTVKIPVWFHPTEGTTYSGTLNITSNDPLQNPFTVYLEGTGVDTVYPVGTPLWSYMITGSFDTSPKGIHPIGDITGDTVSDVVVASEDNFIRCFNGNASVDADLMWATEIYSGNVYQQNAITTIPDINGDGYEDLIVGTTGGDRSVRAISGKTGLPLWRYDTHAFGGGGWVYQVNTAFDYNSDGDPDVLACAGDDGNNTGPRRVFCINGNTGIPIWICPTEGAVFSVIGVDDFTGDGLPDVVAGATNAAQTQSRVYGINGASGAILWTNIPMGSSTWALIQVDDFTGDGIRDFASGDYSGNIYLHNVVTGARVVTTMVQSAALILRFEDMGDVNKDDHPDFIVGHSGAKAVIINGYTGAILWQKPLSDKAWNVTNMGDITWDGTNDCGVGTLYQDNRTYFLDGANGDILSEITGNTPVDALDAIPDIVGDNSMELVAGGRNGGLICLSGGYDSTLIAIPGPISADQFQVMVYPNPASDELFIEMILPRSSGITLRITDIAGREIYTRVLPVLSGGNHIVELRRDEIPGESGAYILTVDGGSFSAHQKLILR
jgi:hypothetical protein